MKRTIWTDEELASSLSEIVASISRNVRLLGERAGGVESPEEIYLFTRETTRILSRLARVMEGLAGSIEESDALLSSPNLTEQSQVEAVAKKAASKLRIVAVLLYEAQTGATNIKDLVSNFSPEFKQRAHSRR